MGQLESGELSTVSEPVDLCRLIAEASAPFRAAPKALVAWQLMLPERPVVVDVPAKRLAEILTELFSNAARFTTAGSITAELYRGSRLKTVEFRGHRLDVATDWVIEVRDSGIGIQAENQGGIFTSFFQEGGTLGRREALGGLGMGLSIAKLTADHIGAKLWFESEAGNGSCFYLAVPEGESSEV